MISGTALAGTTALAGCSSNNGSDTTASGDQDTPADDGGDETTEAAPEMQFTWGGPFIQGAQCWDCVNPVNAWKMQEEIHSRSDNRITMDMVPESQLCGVDTCPTKVQNNVTPLAPTSIGNTTKFFPEMDGWLLPYTFPNRQALDYTLWHEKTWEEFWVPFAKRYGAIPVGNGQTPGYRQVFIGKGAGIDEAITDPSQLEGLKIRKTPSEIPRTALETWGANPVELSFTDAVQGLNSGVVDGIETFGPPLVAFGIAEACDQAIISNWGCGTMIHWANVDWLKSLHPRNRDIIAAATKDVTERLVHLTTDVVENRTGISSPPPEGSGFAENNIEVTMLNDEQLSAWKDPIEAINNRDKYELVFNKIDTLTGMDDYFNTIYERARESSAPDTPEDYTADAWWDDYLDQI